MSTELTTESKNDSPIWCVVANIVLERPYGPNGVETRRGTKRFRAGAKVVCVRFFWGGSDTSVMAIGRDRFSQRYICTIVRADRLANWRVELVYSPRILQLIREYIAENKLVRPRFDGTEKAKAIAEEIVRDWIQTEFGSKEQPPTSTRPTRHSEDESPDR